MNETTLSEILTTRLSHDLIGNIGAVANAVELLNEGDEEEDLTKTYTVTINGTDKKGDSSVNVGEFGNAAAGDKINIPNTKLSGLPSTGGIGTTIFTIGGCAIMIIAAGLFFASRRKSSKDVSKE